MGQALYRKYRSKSLDEIVGQEHITRTLRRAIETGRISHAYLFTGPRGVGKTSIARILAHELNGLPYTGEDNHLDIIEIDAASSGGVDEVRDLRDKVYIAPSSGTYKVYIIDEVHMMTTAAFNALLKTLEEPPAHAIFILATTEAHKLPATIVSRTQRFMFKPIPLAQVVAHLRHIANEEHIDIADDAIELIAEHGGGAFRDSISMLDQVASARKRVTRASVEKLLGIPPKSAITALVSALQSGDTAQTVQTLAALKTDGYQAGTVARQLAETIRDQLLAGTPPLGTSETIGLLKRLIDVPASHDPDRLLELTILESLPQDIAVPPMAATKPPVPKPEPAPEQRTAPPEQPPADRSDTAEADTKEPEQAREAPPLERAASYETAWQLVLESLKKQYNTLYGIIRMAQPGFQPGKLTLTFGYAFHQKRAADAKNKKIISAMLEEATGERFSIECRFDKTVTPPAPVPSAASTDAPAASPALGAISAIFGGGEVL
jgi:DNA polymerase-3 subunit gamma/tau